MSRLPDHFPPPAIKISVQRLACFDCGAETNATCSCGVAYLPKATERAAEYVQQHPTASVREIAEETGVGHGTAQRAKSGVPHGTPEPGTVTGRDGKGYPAVQPQRTRGTNASPTLQQAPDAAVKMIIGLYQKLNFAKRSEARDGMDRIDEEENDGVEGS
jgi:hypothetical protein